MGGLANVVARDVSVRRRVVTYTATGVLQLIRFGGNFRTIVFVSEDTLNKVTPIIIHFDYENNIYRIKVFQKCLV